MYPWAAECEWIELVKLSYHQIGRLYDWAENQSKGLQIRKDVTEDFVRRGSFHILADEKPMPRVHWHPQFLERLKAATSKVPA